ncbi:hypothetical protein CAPTEDRAFT_224728 [Capitella teleta]|uniref:Integrator complex subunit 4 n=1 Tax=Capitella teleta TaxID=283909 RepID=R7V720_CAPTE|nr:hypothetical protein CAPTEDRAFT_224728 [Capitella teleta]|eukprot:ELU14658.1 hypothetical protein CAPTEDRAFT_224728 [Capitella teleta]
MVENCDVMKFLNAHACISARFTFYSDLETKEEPKPKKLKLSHRAKSKELQLDLNSCSTPHDALQVLLKLHQDLPLPGDQVQTALGVLLDRFCKEADAAVRAKIAHLLTDLIKSPSYNTLPLFDDVKSMIVKEKSHKVLSQLIALLVTIGHTQPLNTKLHTQCIDIALKHLDDSSHLVMRKCLEVLGKLGFPEAKAKNSDVTLQNILEKFSLDADPRVRCAAFEAMLTWHQRGQMLNRSSYKQLTEALKDDYEGVRLVAMKLIWVHCQLTPESLIRVVDSDEEIRQVDDGFAKLCNMVNDESMVVRAEAAQLLGSLHAVSSKFLLQTLDKKLISNMRRKTSAHERQKAHYQSGQWSTGKRWADDAPKESVDPEGVSLITSGACGAFVHGLEDEYLEVRNASIDSVCELALVNREFAVQCQDFLFDMFNDEIDSVRLNAINSLRKISELVSVREDQLEIILGVLKDFSYEMREALHAMCSSIRVATKPGMNSLVMGILDNMKRYPQDRTSIWKCMQKLGQNHPALVTSLVAELLSTHPYFEAIEPDVDDPSYISILVLVFNSAVVSSTIMPLFPEHTIRHYIYLRDTLPDVIPHLQLVAAHSSCEDTKTGSGAKEFLEETLRRLSPIVTLDRTSAQQLIHIGIRSDLSGEISPLCTVVILRDLERVIELDSSLAATASCTQMFLQCQLSFIELLSGSDEKSPLAIKQHGTMQQNKIKKIIKMSDEMEHGFQGLGVTDIASIRQLRLRAQTLQLLALLTKGLTASMSACLQYLQILSRMEKLFSSGNIEPDAFTKFLINSMRKFESCEPAIFLETLKPAFKNHCLCVLRLEGQLQQARASIVEPPASSDAVAKFTAGMTTAVKIVANISNVPNTQNIAIQVRYPDQQVHLIHPPVNDFHKTSPLMFQLVTEALLSHSLWSDPGSVEIRLVLKYKPDKSLVSNDKSGTKSALHYDTIDLCAPIRVQIHPGPQKR